MRELPGFGFAGKSDTLVAGFLRGRDIFFGSAKGIFIYSGRRSDVYDYTHMVCLVLSIAKLPRHSEPENLNSICRYQQQQPGNMLE